MDVAGSVGDIWLLFYSCLFLTTAGAPFPSDAQVYVAEGRDAVLACGPGISVDLSQVSVMEWLRVDGPFPVTLHVLRHGHELVKDQAPEYLGRTALLGDGSLKLLGVRQRDTGTYKCVLLTRSSLRTEATMSLSLVQGSELNFLLWRTAANQLLVWCSSSGWTPKPLVSVVDWTGSTVSTVEEPEVVLQADGLFSVSVGVNLEAVNGPGNKSVICRVEVPHQLIREKMIPIADDFLPQEAGPAQRLVGILGLCVCVCVLIGAAARYAASHWRTNKLDSWTEYGHTASMETGGASEDTAKASGLRVRGTEASNILAAADLDKMKKLKEGITSVGNKLGVEPALIAAIISRQSQAGSSLSTSGFGRTDPNCYGLMQINKHYHAVKGDAYGTEHIDQGVTFLIQLVKTMRRSRPDWTKEQQLKGALACYIAGEDKVLPLSYEDLDSVTPNKDFSSDVVARAHWFAQNGF